LCRSCCAGDQHGRNSHDPNQDRSHIAPALKTYSPE
jgi:hypothetical protein